MSPSAGKPTIKKVVASIGSLTYFGCSIECTALALNRPSKSPRTDEPRHLGFRRQDSNGLPVQPGERQSAEDKNGPFNRSFITVRYVMHGRPNEVEQDQGAERKPPAGSLHPRDPYC
jgi:hypothetical protein